MSQEELLAAIQKSSSSSQKKPIFQKPLPLPLKLASPVSENKPGISGASAPGRVVSKPLNPTRAVKGAPSTLTPNKRKRLDQKPKVISKEEAAALKAREAAKKRVEEREKSLLGLYKH